MIENIFQKSFDEHLPGKEDRYWANAVVKENLFMIQIWKQITIIPKKVIPGRVLVNSLVMLKELKQKNYLRHLVNYSTATV